MQQSSNTFHIVEAPIDFGYSHLGRYIPQPFRDGARQIADAMADELSPHIVRTELHPPYPTKNERWSEPLKFDRELAEAYQCAHNSLQGTLGGCFPLVVGGDHTVSLLTASLCSLQLAPREKLGLIVFDAHTDFNRPGRVSKRGPIRKRNTTPSGNAHGMTNSLLSGLVDSRYRLASMCQRITSVDSNRIVIIGARAPRYPDLSDALTIAAPHILEARVVRQSPKRDRALLIKDAVRRASCNGKEPFYLSFDFDVLEPSCFPWVNTPVPGGLTTDDIDCIIKLLGKEITPTAFAGMDIVEYNPSGKILNPSVREVVRMLARLAAVKS